MATSPERRLVKEKTLVSFSPFETEPGLWARAGFRLCDEAEHEMARSSCRFGGRDAVARLFRATRDDCKDFIDDESK